MLGSITKAYLSQKKRHKYEVHLRDFRCIQNIFTFSEVSQKHLFIHQCWSSWSQVFQKKYQKSLHCQQSNYYKIEKKIMKKVVFDCCCCFKCGDMRVKLCFHLKQAMKCFLLDHSHSLKDSQRMISCLDHLKIHLTSLLYLKIQFFCLIS